MKEMSSLPTTQSLLPELEQMEDLLRSWYMCIAKWTTRLSEEYKKYRKFSSSMAHAV